MSTTHLATQNNQEFEGGLATLKKEIDALQIVDQKSYIEGAQIEVALKTAIKRRKADKTTGIDSAKEHLQFLQNELKKDIAQAEQLLEAINKKRIAYTEEEKRKAKIEEDRENARLAEIAKQKAEADRIESERLAAENRKAQEAEAKRQEVERQQQIEEQRKAGEITKRAAEAAAKKAAEERERQQKEAREAEAKERERAKAAAEEAKKAPPPTVRVVPNVPVVAGIKNQTHFYAEVTDSSKILFAYDKAIREGASDRAAFLSRFVIVDEKEVGSFARDTKDNAKATAALPGVRFYSEG